MSSRYISIEEINSILAAIEDQSGIELLKEIRDNAVNESDVPKHKAGKQLTPEEAQKESQEKSFIGFAKEDDIAKDDDVKKGTLNRLANSGLVVKGGFIPLGGEIINSYKLTNEGYALLYLVGKIEGRQGGKGTVKTNDLQAEQRETRKQEREEQRSKIDNSNTIKANETVKISKKD